MAAIFLGLNVLTPVFVPRLQFSSKTPDLGCYKKINSQYFIITIQANYSLRTKCQIISDAKNILTNTKDNIENTPFITSVQVFYVPLNNKDSLCQIYIFN